MHMAAPLQFQHQIIDSEGPVDVWLAAIADLSDDKRLDLLAGFDQFAEQVALQAAHHGVPGIAGGPEGGGLLLDSLPVPSGVSYAGVTVPRGVGGHRVRPPDDEDAGLGLVEPLGNWPALE